MPAKPSAARFFHSIRDVSMQVNPVVFLTALLAALVAVITPAHGQIAVEGDTVYTMAGEPITDGVVLIRDGEIEEVGAASEVSVPEGYDVHEASVVTPGLIDARSVVGLAGYYNIEDDQDQLDHTDPIQPELRAIDAYDAREELVRWLRGLGVTTVHTGHGPGALISGQTIIVKTLGDTVEEALVDDATMVAMTLGAEVAQQYDSPGTRAKGLSLLRQQFIRAEDYREGAQSEDESQHPSRDLQLEVLAQVLDGEMPALIQAQGLTEIMGALRLQEEFGFELVLDGAAEAYEVLDEIREAGVPVFVHPPMVRAGDATRNAAFDTPKELYDAGIPMAFQSGFEGYVPKTRVVLFEAAVATANGLDRADALSALTVDAARLLEIDDQVGSLEPGKDADVVLFDGDPFEYTTRTCTVIINGELASDECR